MKEFERYLLSIQRVGLVFITPGGGKTQKIVWRLPGRCKGNSII